MYYAFRFYLDNDIVETSNSTINSIFDVISSILNISYTQYYSCYFAHDQSDNGIYNEYHADLKGKTQFANRLSHVRNQINGQYDDALFLGAISCDDKAKCELQYTHESLTVLKVSIPRKDDLKHISHAMYLNILRELSELGLKINHSFIHYTYTASAIHAFDGGQVGWPPSILNKKRIQQAVKHRSYGYKNRISDVYWGNAILSEILTEDEKNSIRDVLTEKLICADERYFVFTLSHYCEPYTVATQNRYKKIRAILTRHVV